MATLSPNERNLIEMLRTEAYNVKDCSTKYSFQALAISAAIISFILRFQKEYPPTAYASLFIIFFLLAVVRINLHKLETVNRILGYELHIYRRARLKSSSGEGWKTYMREIGWEESLYAWRVIQPMIYGYLYEKRRWIRATVPRDKYEKAYKKPETRWFAPLELKMESETNNKGESANSALAFYPGSYFQKQAFFLHTLSFFSCLPLVLLIFQSLQDEIYSQYMGPTFVFLIVSIGVILVRVNRVTAKRRILEYQLLSINSCAILWLAVIVAHFRALETIGLDEDQHLASYRDYSVKLIEQARQLQTSFPYIYDWIENPQKARILADVFYERKKIDDGGNLFSCLQICVQLSYSRIS